MTDFREEYIESLEKSIKKREREIRKLEPQVGPLQDIVSARHADMETAHEFAKSCEGDFESAVWERDRVTGQISDKKKFLDRDNDLLNGALRRRREDELKKRKRASRQAKEKDDE